jgi:hypothetical protein
VQDAGTNPNQLTKKGGQNPPLCFIQENLFLHKSRGESQKKAGKARLCVLFKKPFSTLPVLTDK